MDFNGRRWGPHCCHQLGADCEEESIGRASNVSHGLGMSQLTWFCHVSPSFSNRTLNGAPNGAPWCTMVHHLMSDHLCGSSIPFLNRELYHFVSFKLIWWLRMGPWSPVRLGGLWEPECSRLGTGSGPLLRDGNRSQMIAAGFPKTCKRLTLKPTWSLEPSWFSSEVLTSSQKTAMNLNTSR